MKVMLVIATLVLSLLMVMPASSAEPLDKCTDVTPIFDFDAEGCAGQVVEQVPALSTVRDEANSVLDPFCPFQRTVYDDVVGGPLNGTACLHVYLD
jgi:hypothetical protein